ncbi:MAG TPA: S1C family serine protease [Candidatus Acidoferrum sp.]|nr:S1C family serine protease [Candidatus Acidoferrum sp.]
MRQQKRIFYLRLMVLTALLLSVLGPAQAQTSQPAQALTSEEVVTRVSPSVVLILVGQGGEKPTALGTGLIVQSDGVFLTAYHVVKDAKQVQVRMKNGEVFDKAELLGFDDRRDVAALRIAAHGLPTLSIAKVDAAKAGESLFVISHPSALPWTASSGILSAIRMADEVSGAGSGYRLLQFTASVSPGSSGGALVDAQGDALGLVVGSTQGQNLNFAIPIESVIGLTLSTRSTPYGSGSGLKLGANDIIATSRVASSAPVPPASADGSPTMEAEPASDSASPDSKQIARRARTIYIKPKPGGAVSGFPSEPLEKKLLENKDFQAMGLVLLKDPGADLMITLERPTMSWDCTYRMTYIETGMIVGAGKSIAWDCIRAAPDIAGQIVKQLKQLRQPNPIKPQQPVKKP